MSSTFSSPYPPIDVEVCRKSLCSLLFEYNDKYPQDQACYIDGLTGQIVTRAEHKQKSLRLAAAFRNLHAVGLEKLHRGSTVVVFSPNSLLYPALMFALVRAPKKKHDKEG